MNKQTDDSKSDTEQAKMTLLPIGCPDLYRVNYNPWKGLLLRLALSWSLTTWILWRFPPHPYLLRVVHHAWIVAQTTWFMPNTFFPSRSLEFCCVPRRVPTWQPPVKNLWCWFSNKLLRLATFHMCCYICNWGTSSSCASSAQEGTGRNLCLVSPGLPPRALPLCWSVLCALSCNKV